MALLYVPRYTLPFSSEAGTETEWELDILRSYDTTEAIPSWVSEPLGQRLIGSPSPIVIEYQKDYDIYKPIIGSSAKINLIVTEAGQYDDFNAGGPFEYKVRLRNITNAGSATTTLTIASDSNRNTTRTNLFMDQAARQSFFAALIPGETYAEADANVPTTVAGSINGVAIPIGTVLLVNTIRVSVRGNFDFGTMTAGTSFDLLSMGVRGDETYWCGFISPIDGTEEVTSFPFPISFTAVDGLGLLEQGSVSVPERDSTLVILDIIKESLVQIGLDLDLFIDSGIRWDDENDVRMDALLAMTADYRAVYTNEEQTERMTRKEAIEGSLSAINCKIYQSQGRWYITNASTHGGLGDIPTWNTFTMDDESGSETFGTYIVGHTLTDGTKSTDSILTESSIRYTIDGSDTQSLVPITNDLVLNTRRPLGSVECRPKDLVPVNFAQHGSFELPSWEDAWIPGPNSASQTLTRTDDFTAPFGDQEINGPSEGKYAIVTNNSRYNSSDDGDVWFQNRDGYPVDQDTPTELSFDWNWQRTVDSSSNGLVSCRILFNVYIDLDDNEDGTPGMVNITRVNQALVETFNVNRLYWNFESNRWGSGVPGPGSSFITDSTTTNILSTPNIEAIRAGLDYHSPFAAVFSPGSDYISHESNDGDAGGNWMTVERTIGTATSYDDPVLGNVAMPPGKMFLRFFYPTGSKQGPGKKNRGNRQGSILQFIDNISIKNDYKTDITAPVFERLQSDYTQTYTYEPRFADGVRPLILQRIGQEGFYRRDVPAEQATPTTLESIGTQLKLNDFRTQFRYYEGTLLNLSEVPLSQHHKVYLNWASVNYTENASGILNGGKFNPKKNTFEGAFYIPNQRASNGDPSDIAPIEYGDIQLGQPDPITGQVSPGFYHQNIDLVPAAFPGRSDQTFYAIRLDLRGVTTEGVLIDASGDSGLGTSTITHQPFITSTARPGTEVEGTLVINVHNAYDPTVGVTLLNPLDDPDLDQDSISSIVIGTPIVTGNIITVPYTIIQPQASEYEVLSANVVTTLFTPEPPVGIDVVDLTIDNNVENTLPTGNTGVRVQGLSGQEVEVKFEITPSDPMQYQVSPGNVNTPEQSGTTNFRINSYRESIVGNALIATINYEIPSGGETGATLTFTGTAAGVTSIENPVYGFAGTFTGIPTGAVASDATYSHTGIEGATFDGLTILSPTEGNFLQASGFSVPVATPGVTNIQFDDAAPGTGAVIMRYTVSFGADHITDRAIAIVADATAVQSEPYSVTFVANNLGVEGGSLSFSSTTPQSTNRLGYTTIASDFDSFQLYVTPAEDMSFLSSSNVSININEAAVVNATASEDGIVSFPETQFTVAPALIPINTDGQLVFNIDGTFPTVGGDYIVDVNVRGAATMGSSQVQVRVTKGDLLDTTWRIVEDSNGNGSSTMTLTGEIGTPYQAVFNIEPETGSTFVQNQQKPTLGTVDPDFPLVSSIISAFAGDGQIIFNGIFPATNELVNTSVTAQTQVALTNGMDGASGVSYAGIAVYQRSATKPGQPYGGTAQTFMFGANGVTYTTPPLGWSRTIPNDNENPLYITLANPTTQGIGDVLASWSDPTVFTQRGADGEDAINGASVVIYYADDTAGLNAETQQDEHEFVKYQEYEAGTDIPGPDEEGFVKFIGNDGMSVHPIYADNAAGDQPSFSSANKDFVTFYESLIPPILIGTGATDLSGELFVRHIGIAGMDGEKGDRGLSGLAAELPMNVRAVYARFANTTDAAAAGSSLGASLTIGDNNPRTYVQFEEFQTVPAALPSSGYVLIRGVDGEDGEDGEEGASGQSVYPIFATDAAGNNRSFVQNTGGVNREWVNLYESEDGNRPNINVNVAFFVKYVGDNGMDGTSATNYAQIQIYQRSTLQPGGHPNINVTFQATSPFVDYTITAPWQEGIPSGDLPVWTQIAVAAGLGLPHTDEASFTTPRMVFADGEQGQRGQDGQDGTGNDGEAGENGAQLVQLQIYARAATAADLPTLNVAGSPAGTVDVTFRDNETEPVDWTTPTGWNRNIQGTSGTDPVWTTRAIATRLGYGDDNAAWDTMIQMVDPELVQSIVGQTLAGSPATSISIAVPHVGIPATGGNVLVHVTANGAWETGNASGVFVGGARYGPTTGIGDAVITFEAPYMPDTSNGIDYGFIVRSTDGTNTQQVGLSQRDRYGRRIVFVNTLPVPAQPGILYITPTA